MADINSGPPSGLNDCVRGQASPDALYELNTTPPFEFNWPSFPFVHEVWYEVNIHSFIHSFLKILRGPIFHCPPQNRSYAVENQSSSILFPHLS